MAEQETKTLENQDFLVETHEEPGCCLVAKVFIKPQASQKAYKKAIKQVNKEISIPGFRKGHAPDKTVISRYSSYVEREWKDNLVSDAYRAAVTLTDIYPLSKESIKKPKLESCSQEEGAVVRISYEHYPHVPEIDFSKVTLPHFSPEEISDKQVDEVIEEVRKNNADWEEVTERGVDEGDYVEITIDAIEEDPPKPIVTNRRFEVSDERLVIWLKNLLLGMKVDETAEGVTELDQNASESTAKAFKPTKVRVTLHKILKIVLPPVDDALAAKAKADSLDDLKNKIRANLEKEAEEKLHDVKVSALENALLDRYSFDVPASFLELEKEERISRRLDALREEGISEEEVLDRQETIASEVLPLAERALRLHYLNKQIAKQGNVTLTNDELNTALMEYLPHLSSLYAQDKDGSRDMVSRLATTLLQRKVKSYALSQVK